MKRPFWVATCAGALLAAAGCSRLSDDEAVALVRSYVDRKADAYRAADAGLVDGVTSTAEGRKILGLIGVKSDMGVTLDAVPLDFTVLRVERAADRVTVFTEERWRYADRRIGSGEQVGQESVDRYRMRYHLAREEGRWVVDAIEFDVPPRSEGEGNAR